MSASIFEICSSSKVPLHPKMSPPQLAKVPLLEMPLMPSETTSNDEKHANAAEFRLLVTSKVKSSVSPVAATLQSLGGPPRCRS